jgi:hypothetical protein
LRRAAGDALAPYIVSHGSSFLAAELRQHHAY